MHAITEDFDTNEDFVTEDEGSALETSSLGTGKADKRVRSTIIDEDEANPTGVSTPSDASLREDIAPYLDKVSPLCHIGDVSSIVEPIGSQENVLERTKELEPLLASLNPITYTNDLEEWTEVIVFFFFW